MSCAALLLGWWEAARRSHYQPVTILVRQDLPAHKTTMAGGLFQPLFSKPPSKLVRAKDFTRRYQETDIYVLQISKALQLLQGQQGQT